MQSLTFITLSRNPEAVREIREALTGSGQTRLLGECDNADNFVSEVLRLKPTAAIIVLDAVDSDRNLDLIAKLAAKGSQTAIITAARDCSPTVILGSLRAGAREFLQLPIIPNEWQTVLQRVAGFCEKEENALRKNGKVIAVFSGKGGAGVSFLATNLAAAMSKATLLIDLNLQAGDAASFLGLKPRYSLADFVTNRTRLDDSLINSLITQHSTRLSLLAAPQEPHESEDIDPAHVTEVLHLLGQRWECLVLDLPHTFDPITISAFDIADDILLVMTLDIPGIRSTKRALKVFERMGYPRGKIHVVVNRFTKGIDVELSKVEAHLNEQLIGLVPNDYRKVIGSINLGQPLVLSEPASKLTVEIKRIAALVAGSNHHTSAQPRKRLLSSVFGRPKSTGPLELMEMPDSA
ncbi:MAG: CpaE family protein [Pyrinomonadaceae bacterium]